MSAPPTVTEAAVGSLVQAASSAAMVERVIDKLVADSRRAESLAAGNRMVGSLVAGSLVVDILAAAADTVEVMIATTAVSAGTSTVLQPAKEAGRSAAVAVHYLAGQS